MVADYATNAELIGGHHENIPGPARCTNRGIETTLFQSTQILTCSI